MRSSPGITYWLANLTIGEETADDAGVIFGTSLGGLLTIDWAYPVVQEQGRRRTGRLTSAMMLPNTAAAEIPISFGLRRPNYCIISACDTGSNVIGEASETIRRGDARAMVASGSEAPMVLIGVAAYDRTLALSARNDERQRASGAFDAKRDSFVFAEGAATLMLENLEFARATGANILAEIIGYGATCNAFHISAPAEAGGHAALAMAKAQNKAALKPQDVDHISASGTSTPLDGGNETQATKELFGNYACHVPINSTKSTTRRLLGSPGAVEAIACVKTIREEIVHPTIDYEYRVPDCDLDYVPSKPPKAKIKIAVSSSFGFGRHNAWLVPKQFSE